MVHPLIEPKLPEALDELDLAGRHGIDVHLDQPFELVGGELFGAFRVSARHVELVGAGIDDRLEHGSSRTIRVSLRNSLSSGTPSSFRWSSIMKRAT